MIEQGIDRPTAVPPPPRTSAPVRILFATSESPGSGGSATAAYDLFRIASSAGHDVHFASLLDDGDAAWSARVLGPHSENPDRLPGVHSVRVPVSLRTPSTAAVELIQALQPEVVAGFGHIAVNRLKGISRALPVAFVTGSCRQAQDYVTSGLVRDAQGLRRRLEDRTLIARPVHRHEVAAVDRCDLVITHSQLTFDMMSAFFPGASGKIWPGIVPFEDWIVERARAARSLAQPFDQRDIDLLFVASNWRRPEKNYALVADLASRMQGASVHVVGDVPHPIPGVVHHGFIGRRDEVFALIGRSRCVACPSLIDAAPGILYEATVLGANVVASLNCGNAHLCPPGLVAETLDADVFIQCVRRGLERPYPTSLAAPSWRAFEHLMKVLAALARPIGGPRVAA